MQVTEALERARTLARQGDDDGARQAYLDVLRLDSAHFDALNELGTLAMAGGYRSAARTAYMQAIAHHPGNPLARVNLANLLREDQDVQGAKVHYEAALAADPNLPEAHQGMAWVLGELCLPGADQHRDCGFAGRALLTQPYRGTGTAVPLLLLVSARGGNIPTRAWVSDRRFTIHAIYMEYVDPCAPLPPHTRVLNAIGDADLCGAALERAEELLRHSEARVINAPARVRVTGRAENARRLGAIPGVIAPTITVWQRQALLAAKEDLRFPILLRSPGFHTGRHFVLVESPAKLTEAAGSIAGEELLAIEYLDARGVDGMARKYRVMFIGGRLFPLHLAISADWKVHYFSADMERQELFRQEEQRFLDDMQGVLGARAMRALTEICERLGLDYAGIDFALSPDGSVLLFEANATMVVNPPGADPMWDYRRPAVRAVLEASARMLDP